MPLSKFTGNIVVTDEVKAIYLNFYFSIFYEVHYLTFVEANRLRCF